MTDNDQPPNSRQTRETDIWELSYYSASALHEPSKDLQRIVETAAARNRHLGVTGMLVYWNESFFQVLEGRRSALEALYQDYIAPSRAHTNIIRAHQGAIVQRSFGAWSMAGHVAEGLEIRSIETLIDRIRQGTSEFDPANTVGAALLQSFLSVARSEIDQKGRLAI
jgi:hypothetical protein